MPESVAAPPGGRLRAEDRRTVVVIDDHTTFADLLRVAVDSEPDLSCVGVAYDLDSGIAMVQDHQPDVVVLDFRFSGDTRDGLDATALIRAGSPGAHVVLLTGYADIHLLQGAAASGASSLLTKSGSLPDLLTAVRGAGKGGLIVHPTLLLSLVSDDVPPLAPSFDDVALSRRERDVLWLLTDGHDARSIAHRLGISLSTCRGYVKTLLQKLGAHSQLEAVAIARRRGLVCGGDLD